MNANESKNDNQPDDLPKVGESIDVWFAGHMPVDCVSHNDDGTINVRMPDGDVVVAENVMGNWEVSMD